MDQYASGCGHVVLQEPTQLVRRVPPALRALPAAGVWDIGEGNTRGYGPLIAPSRHPAVVSSCRSRLATACTPWLPDVTAVVSATMISLRLGFMAALRSFQCRAAMNVVKLPRAVERRAGLAGCLPAFALICTSMSRWARAIVKLCDSWLGGYSANILRKAMVRQLNCMIKKLFLLRQSSYWSETISALSNGSMRRLNNLGMRKQTNGSVQTAKPPGYFISQ